MMKTLLFFNYDGGYIIPSDFFIKNLFRNFFNVLLSNYFLKWLNTYNYILNFKLYWFWNKELFFIENCF